MPSSVSPEIEYWRKRLVYREYGRWVRPLPFQELSALFQHEGSSFFFPLGTGSTEMAASKALEIQQLLVDEGWPSVFRKYPREFTLALFWRDNPMVFTYTTLYTIPDSHTQEGRGKSPKTALRDLVSVAIVEEDDCCRRALGKWVSSLQGYVCQGEFPNATEALMTLKRNPVDLVLVNRQLGEDSAERLVAKLRESSRYIPALTYRIYHCSDELFISQPGTSGGYYFRRCPPKDLLDPIRDIWRRHPPRLSEWQTCVSGYVQRLFLFSEEAGESPSCEALTSREFEILGCLCRGVSDKEIADTLQISRWTVHTHLKRIYEKLEVRSRAEAILKFYTPAKSAS